MSNASSYPRIHEDFTRLYESLLGALTASLNDIHHAYRSPKYWRVLLGPWLTSWLVVFIDRFEAIESAFSLHPDLHTIGLAKPHWTTSTDSRDFMINCADDLFNLQLYSEILVLTSRPVILQERVPNEIERPSQHSTGSWAKRAIKLALASCLRASYIFDTPKHDAIVVDSYLLKRELLGLWLRSNCRVWPQYQNSFHLPKSIRSEADSRQQISSRLQTTMRSINGIRLREDVLAELTSRHLPLCFVEGYKSLIAFSEELYPRIPRGIFTTHASFYDEAFKHWAGRSCEKGTRLLLGQHGGNGRHSEFEPVIEHEHAIADTYMSWGSPENKREGNERFVPPLNFIGLTPHESINATQGVLFGATHVGRFFHTLIPLLSPQRFETYLVRQRDFTRALNPKIKCALTIRTLYDYFGWDIRDRWAEHCPEAAIDQGEVPFLQALKSNRLYVCDHLMTTYLEALRVNIPTVLYWDEGDYVLPPESTKAFKLLREVGILHASAEAAAQTINAIYDDIATWWQEPARQIAKNSFLAIYGGSVADPIELWKNEILLSVDQKPRH